MSIIIGIDPSITSTGVCVWDVEHNVNRYYNIIKNPTKKIQNFKSNHISILPYSSPALKDLDAIEKEQHKTDDVVKISRYIDSIIDVFNPDKVIMEAVAFSASGRVEQLAGLNYLIRLRVVEHNVPVFVLTPQMIKKQFVGNGAATKEEMISGWKACDNNSLEYIEKFPKNAEDLADAYAMAHYKL